MMQRHVLVVLSLSCICIVNVSSFVPVTRTLHVHATAAAAAASIPPFSISSKARQFFTDVQDGLRSRQIPEIDDIGRVLKFW